MMGFSCARAQCWLGVGLLAFLPALASGGDSWFSKVHVQEGQPARPASADRLDHSVGTKRLAPGRSETSPRTALGVTRDTAVFDIVISLYNDPAGDDNATLDAGPADVEQNAIEAIVEHFADSVCEQSNGAHKLGTVRIFDNGTQRRLADVVWNEREWPRAHISGFGVGGRHIFFGDVFPNGRGPDSNFKMLENPEGAGYTLGHEWGHYVYGLYDEYQGRTSSTGSDSSPKASDVPTNPSIMNSQWRARGGNFEWLNHSTSDNIGNATDTAQGRVYGISGWETLVQDTDNDPRTGNRAVQPDRAQYTALDGEQPTAADNWVREELPGDRMDCRDELAIQWVGDDIELELVIDTSGSMGGSPIANARTAARTLVDVLEPGQTSLGVIEFADSADEAFPIESIPDPDTGVKDRAKAAIAGLNAGGSTALWDGAQLALEQLVAFVGDNGTQGAEVTFLLSDGQDNNSTATQGTVTSAYQANDIPIIAFGYGGGAPGGVLRQVANETGGEFFSSPTTLAEIQAAFLAASTAVTNSVALQGGTVTVAAGDETTEPLVIDDTLESFTAIASFTGNEDDIDLQLIDPAGGSTPLTCDVSGGEVSCSATMDSGAASGGSADWALELTNNAGAPRDINTSVLGNLASGGGFDVNVESLSGNIINYPEPVLVTAMVMKERPLTGVNVQAELETPTGEVRSLPLVDDGTGGDAEAADGIYSALLADYRAEGTYQVRVVVDNADRNARFTLEGTQPARPRAPSIQGMQPVAPTLPPVTQNFQRVTTLQFTVQGVVSDDHPAFPAGDAAACTELVLDNADQDGRLERGADRDCFRLVRPADPTPSTASEGFNVRLSGLIDLDPALELFDATTGEQLTRNTLRDARNPNGGSLTVGPLQALDPDGDGQTLIAVVEASENDPTGRGTYAISAGPTLRSERGNTPPQAEPLIIRVDEDSTGQGQLTANDPDDDRIRFELLVGPALGQVSIDANGAFSYTPDPSANGRDNVVYRVIDARGGMGVGAVGINIVGDDDPPRAEPDVAASGAGGEGVTIDVLGNDVDPEGAPLTLVSVDGSTTAGGTVTENADGTVTYTPPADFTGVDDFTYEVTDGTTEPVRQVVQVSVGGNGDGSGTGAGLDPDEVADAIDGEAAGDALDQAQEVAEDSGGDGGGSVSLWALAVWLLAWLTLGRRARRAAR